MALTHVQLYEALKPSVGEEAARLMAEVVPPAEHLATKSDIAEVRSDFSGLRAEFADLKAEMREGFAQVRGEMREGFAELRGEMREGFAQVRGEMHADKVSMLKWMIGMFIPVWLGSWGTVVAVLVKG